MEFSVRSITLLTERYLKSVRKEATRIKSLVTKNGTFTVNWSRSTNFKPHIESGYVFSGERGSTAKGDGKATATFRFQTPKSGRYQLLMAYSAHEARAKNVPGSVSSGSQRKDFVVDQTVSLQKGNHFRPIDTVDLAADTETIIRITNSNTVGFVILDALQLLPIKDESK